MLYIGKPRSAVGRNGQALILHQRLSTSNVNPSLARLQHRRIDERFRNAAA